MDLFSRITLNTTVLTPNRRLSAAFSKKYSEWQMSQQISCWQTVDIMPFYPSWLDRTWRQSVACDLTSNSLLLTTHQEQMLWEKILREAPENENLLQITDTAKLAHSAWEVLKRWQVDLDDNILNLTEDSKAFLQWAKKFKSICQKKRWIDHHSLADIIAEKIKSGAIKPPQHIILMGFTEIAPQYLNLLNICAAKGAQVEHHEAPTRNQTTHSIGLTDTETEIRTMARWAKSLIGKTSSVGCIIPSLESMRESVMRIFSDVFGEQQFNISAGKSLISYPIIFDALKLLALDSSSMSIESLSTLLRSPFTGDAERERNRRSLYEMRLRNANITSITLKDLVDPNIKHSLANTCPELCKRIETFLISLKSLAGEKILASEWLVVFTTLLSELGWPGERSLNSPEFQVVQNAWLPMLSEYAALDNILGPQHYRSALHYLNCLASNTVFQPESPETTVNILGLLEAAEIPFEHAWVMGLDDSSWPSRPKPNPFIPLRLQKTLKMPNASAERELLYCQQLTKQLEQSTENIIFSYPHKRDDAELRPSSLLKKYPSLNGHDLSLTPFETTAEKIFQTQSLEWLQDDTAPAIATTEPVQGGVRIFKTQAECPFKAFAELRLHAKKIEETSLGLRNLDRGNLVHAALELLWQELKDSATLILKSDEELKNLIHQCAKDALNKTVEANNTNNKRYLSLELLRLEKLLWDWLQYEKRRPPFSVMALEREISATIGNITANFRVDRIDQLTTESSSSNQLIIDYKTGKELDKSDWFGDRLDEPQLPIYCIANPDDTIGIAFAKVNPSKMEMIGASKDPVKMKTISLLGDIKQADATLWHEQLRIWNTHLAKLSDDFYQGKANVNPKDTNQTCRLCSLHSLCRIHEMADLDEESDNE